MKNFGEKGAWVYPRMAQIFLSTPYYLRNGQSYELQIRQVYSQGPCQQKPFKNLGENGPWANPGTPQIFGVPRIISGMGKATNVKFGRYIQRVHANKSPLKFGRKGSVCIYRDCPNFLSTPYYLGNGLSYKLQILQVHSQGPSKQKPF